MTWSNELFLSEMMGTLALMLGITSTLYYITRNKLDGQKKVWTFAIGAGISVALGVAVAVSLNGAGYVNPAAALMFMIESHGFEKALSAFSGQLVGSLTGFVIATALNLAISNIDKEKDVLCYVEDTFKAPGTHRWINDAAAEVLGTLLFLIGIYGAVNSGPYASSILGFHLITILVLVMFGDFPMLINPAVAIQVVLGSIVFSKGARSKEQLTWLGVHLVANLSTAAALGGVLSLF